MVKSCIPSFHPGAPYMEVQNGAYTPGLPGVELSQQKDALQRQDSSWSSETPEYDSYWRVHEREERKLQKILNKSKQNPEEPLEKKHDEGKEAVEKPAPAPSPATPILTVPPQDVASQAPPEANVAETPTNGVDGVDGTGGRGGVSGSAGQGGEKLENTKANKFDKYYHKRLDL